MTSKVSTPSVLKQAWSQKTEVSSDKLILSTDNKTRLDSVSQVYEMVQKSRADQSSTPLLLPNVLLVGPPGTGKTMSAQMLAQRSGFPFIVVCGGDLLAVTGDDPASGLSSDVSSSAPGRYLRDVLHGARAVNGGRGFLVILDEVEGIIADRGRRKDKLEQQMLEEGGDDANAAALESKECIHILLNMLRLNTAALGVIINTSLKLQFVDPALLDRMDRVVTLELPDASVRLTLLVSNTKDLLADYINDSITRGFLNTLSSCTNIPLDACTEEAFCESIENLLGSEVNVASFLADGEMTKATPSKRKGRPRKSVSKAVDVDSGKQSEVEDNDSVKADSEVDGEESVKEKFNLFRCLFHLVQCSEGWSHRELSKVIQNIHSEVIATEEYVPLCLKIKKDGVSNIYYCLLLYNVQMHSFN